VAGGAGAPAAVDGLADLRDVAALLEGVGRAQHGAPVPSDRPLHEGSVRDHAHRRARQRVLLPHDHDVAQRLVHRQRHEEAEERGVATRRELVRSNGEGSDAVGVAV
jgi:hypothetical protein